MALKTFALNAADGIQEGFPTEGWIARRLDLLCWVSRRLLSKRYVAGVTWVGVT